MSLKRKVRRGVTWRKKAMAGVRTTLVLLAVVSIGNVWVEPVVGASGTPTCCNGSCCVDSPPLYCVCAPNQPPGSVCLGDEACCLPNGSCDDTIDGLCCDDEGGTLAGQPFCSGTTVICCDGTTCNSGVNSACCSSPGHAGYTCGDDPDGDGVAEPCDNCPGCSNAANTVATDCNNDGDTTDPGEAVGEQCDIDQDGVGDECDNCPTIANPDQDDLDNDNRGDACDNCPNIPNFLQFDNDARCLISQALCGPISDIYLECPGGDICVTDTTYANGYPGFGNACDNCDDLLHEVQVDCDGDLIGDPCDPDTLDCDGDGVDNDCDEDTDGDGINDDVDMCDFTPNGAPIEMDPDSCFYGTLSADLDGDCDVDDADQAIFDDQFTGQGCEQGGQDFTCTVCGPPPPCNSCCSPCPPPCGKF